MLYLGILMDVRVLFIEPCHTTYHIKVSKISNNKVVDMSQL